MCVDSHINLRVVFVVVTTFYTLVNMRSIYFFRVALVIVICRALIEENIDYDILLEEMPYEQERLEEIVGLMTDTVCSSRSHIRVAGSDFPAEVVKSRLLKLNAEHIRFVFDCLKKNTTEIRNIRQYLLTALYNAPVSINSHYAAQVNHDLYG